MSVTFVLVPLALAAVSALQAGRKEVDRQGRTVHHVQTRMRDESLVARALQDTDAQVSLSADMIRADWQEVRGQFRRDTHGVWQAEFTGEINEVEAGRIISAVDRAYGIHVQQTVLARLRERAPTAGMTVESETVEADESVTVVLAVERGG
ncbi:hypothetical protein [Streptomyces sp. NPDC060194]|uniref:hypothetical protein n=1 Tax=Streptomyces sp. NPDC060194 TaxID=3347069 RepID=UPI003652EC15